MILKGMGTVSTFYPENKRLSLFYGGTRMLIIYHRDLTDQTIYKYDHCGKDSFTVVAVRTSLRSL